MAKVRAMVNTMLRNDSRPLGLVNPHNTCYINVLLQSLFRVWPFRKVLHVLLFQFIGRMGVKASDKSSVLYMLQKVFAEMTLSKDLSYFPDGLLRTMMINTDVQCDSHEFFDHLMASLKSVLESQGDKSAVVLLSIPLTSSQSSIDQLFSGKRLLCRCCLNCRKVFYRPDTFSFLVSTFPRCNG